MKNYQKSIFKITSCLLLAVAFFSCEKEASFTTKENTTITSGTKVTSRSSSCNSTYAVSLYQPGVQAEIYEIDASNGDWMGNIVQVTAPNGMQIENVTGITKMQGLTFRSDEEPFYLVSLGDNSSVPGLPAIYSNHIWEIDIDSGQIIGLFSSLSNTVSDICASDFYSRFAVVSGLDIIGMNVVGIEETPRPNNQGLLMHHLTNLDVLDPSGNIITYELPIANLPVNEEIHGLTWVWDLVSGCSTSSNLSNLSALDWVGHSGVQNYTEEALIVATYNPITQEYNNYSLKILQPTLGNLTVEAFPFSQPIPSTFNTHFSIGWMSDQCTGGHVGNMLTGGDLNSSGASMTTYDFFDNCNPTFQMNPQSTSNGVPREVADFVSIPYPF